jgi:dinuclear metal center YbgI/SA1388 family protein
LFAAVRYCDGLLQTDKFNDWPGAVNGLQVQNRGHISRIAAAVDASAVTVAMAAAARADLLIVHHGLFWGETRPWSGKRYELMRQLMDHDLAVYSSHLPLDAHPHFGNNVQLCAALGLKRWAPFFLENGSYIGWRAKTQLARDALVARLTRVLGTRPIVLPAGPAICRQIGIVSGGAGEQLKRAAAEGVDTFVTGEGPHWTAVQAQDLGLNVFYGGHYATETFGVKALAAHLANKYRLPWQFLDCPTGL